MKIDLVGPSYQQRSLPFDAQRTINLIPIIDQQGKDVVSFLGSPGFSEFCSAGTGPSRGSFISSNGRCFVVSGTKLYEISSTGNVTEIASLRTSSGTVTMAEGTTQLGICDGHMVYCYTYSTDDFEVVDFDGAIDSVGYLSNMDGYFFFVENSSGRFFISDINDITTVDALDYATAESSPDRLHACVNGVGQMWMFGDISTEVWTNTGASSFPFSRISGGVLEVGILAKHSALEIDNTIFWVGKNQFGSGVVYRASGFTPVRVSNNTIEKRILEATNPDEIVGWGYQEDGSFYYILTGGGLETSLCYDLNSKLWTERAYLNEYGNFETEKAINHVFSFNKHLVGSRIDGKIYEMSLDYYDNDGEDMVRERTYTHLFDDGERKRYNKLEIGFETGVGTYTNDPKISLQLSKDGARTWSDWFVANIGKLGEYRKKAIFRRLGTAEQMTFRLRITEKVKVAITGSYLK